MDTPRDDRGGFGGFPSDSLPCVWMTAGVLRYRLCDRGYECERCPLDAAIRGIEPGVGVGEAPAAPAPAPFAPPPPWTFRDDRRYDGAGSWVADLGEGRMRWGLDGLAVRLLDRIATVVLPVPGRPLERGRAACWVADDGALVPIRSPVSGAVLQTNPAVSADPTLVAASPYDAGWLVESRSARSLGDLPGLVTAAARRESAARQMAKLRDAGARRLRLLPPVGRTAADGGQAISDLRRILGSARYHRLVAAILR